MVSGADDPGGGGVRPKAQLSDLMKEGNDPDWGCWGYRDPSLYASTPAQSCLVAHLQDLIPMSSMNPYWHLPLEGEMSKRTAPPDAWWSPDGPRQSVLVCS